MVSPCLDQALEGLILKSQGIRWRERNGVEDVVHASSHPSEQ